MAVCIKIAAGESLSRVFLQKGAAAERYDIVIEEGGKAEITFVTLPEGEICNDICVKFAGRNASCVLRGLYITRGSGRASYNITMNHDVPDCYSNQLFKGLLYDESRADFYGLVKVPAYCIGTEAYQANHNLLLSEEARVRTLPQLEIYADDVKCSHGATIGRLNEDELFYMQSRGISRETARRLQQMAFAAEILDTLPEDIQAQALEYIPN